MADGVTTGLQVRKPEVGVKTDWGGDDGLNEAIDAFDEAITGVTTKALTGNVTLTSTQFEANEVRDSVLVFTDGGLSGHATVTVPAKRKNWHVKNAGATYNVIISAGGTTATVRPGMVSFVYCDGTDCYTADPTLDKIKAPAAAVAMNSQKITGLANGTASTDAVNKGQLDALVSDANVATVAAISSDVTTVAANDANITTVAGIDSDVTTVAGVASDITTVSSNNANVTTVAGISANVTTVAGDSADIQTLAPISTDITTVAGISTDVTAVASDASDIGAVAGSIVNVNTAAANIADISTVAGIDAAVSSVASDATDIGTVATNISDVVNVSDNMADVLNASALVSGLGAADVGALALTGGTMTGAIVFDGAQTFPSSLVTTARSISAGNGLTGGGDLSANRTLSVDFASQAEAETGANTTKSMNPLRTAQAIAALASGGFSATEVITSSTTWVCPAGVTLVKVRMVGGGGSGGTSTSYSSGGGGAGGIEFYTSVTPSTGYSLTVGAAGGVTTAFSRTAYAGGNGSSSNNGSGGGASGVSGDIIINGGAGQNGVNTASGYSAPEGGESMLGVGAVHRSGISQSAGYGGGGAGTVSAGAGVIILEY